MWSNLALKRNQFSVHNGTITHSSAQEANRKAEQAHGTAQQALAELDPKVARRIVQGDSGEAPR